MIFSPEKDLALHIILLAALDYKSTLPPLDGGQKSQKVYENALESKQSAYTFFHGGIDVSNYQLCLDVLGIPGKPNPEMLLTNISYSGAVATIRNWHRRKKPEVPTGREW